MKTADELYDNYFIDYAWDNIDCTIYKGDIIDTLEEEHEEYTPEIIDEIESRLVADQENCKYERYQESKEELKNSISDIIDEYDLEDKYIVQILIDLLNDYHKL